MNLVTLGLILTGIMLNACAQLLLKAGVNGIGHSAFSADDILSIGIELVMQWPIIGRLLCCVISMVVWILGLSHMDVTIAYSMLSLDYVVNAFLVWYLFDEMSSVQHLTGITIILAGVPVLARSRADLPIPGIQPRSSYDVSHRHCQTSVPIFRMPNH